MAKKERKTFDPSAGPRSTASELASAVGGYDDLPGLPEGFDINDYVPLHLRPLLSDTFGLLNGIGMGIIDYGQPRILHNLVKVIQELAKEPATEQDLKVIEALGGIISQASSCGLTADNQQFSGHKHQKTR